MVIVPYKMEQREYNKILLKLWGYDKIRMVRFYEVVFRLLEDDV